MKELTHFIGSKHVNGTSGRLGDGFEPMTGEVISRVPCTSKAEVRTAVENAIGAQPAWAATNPQRRARVLMKFPDLVARDMEPLAELLARKHGKTITDAKGDIQRGAEVIDFAIGIPIPTVNSIRLAYSRESDDACTYGRHAPPLSQGSSTLRMRPHAEWKRPSTAPMISTPPKQHVPKPTAKLRGSNINLRKSSRRTLKS